MCEAAAKPGVGGTALLDCSPLLLRGPGSILLLYLEQEEPQVNVLGGQQLVALHRVDDGQWYIVCLIALIGEDKVVDDRADPHIVIWALEQKKRALQGRCDLALKE